MQANFMCHAEFFYSSFLKLIPTLNYLTGVIAYYIAKGFLDFDFELIAPNSPGYAISNSIGHSVLITNLCLVDF